MKVLVVEDDLDSSHLLRAMLVAAHLNVRTVGDGDRALVVARDWVPDVVLLDLDTPGPGGIEVCRRLRRFSTAYVLMLAKRAQEEDKLSGFSAGADDYLTKPFSPPELVARVQAMLRRPRYLAQLPHVGNHRIAGVLKIDLDTREVRVGGERVVLTKVEFDLLATLTENVRQVHSRDRLRELVWGNSGLADHAIDVHVSNLRRKLSATGHGGMITTVRGVGYRFTPKQHATGTLVGNGWWTPSQRQAPQRTSPPGLRPGV